MLVAVVTTHPTVTVDVAVVAVVPLETVRLAPVAPGPPTVMDPDNTVELAVAFLIVSPALRVNCVVDAPPRNTAVALDGVVSTPAVEMVVLAVAPKVAIPIAFNAPFTSALGAVSTPAVEIVVLAVAPKVARPIALSVPLKSPLGAVRTPAVEMVVLAVAPKVAIPMAFNAPFTSALGVVRAPATDMVVLAVPPKVETPVAPSVPFVRMFVLRVVAACAMPALTNTTASARIVVRRPLPRLFTYVLILFIIKDVSCYKLIIKAREPFIFECTTVILAG